MADLGPDFYRRYYEDPDTRVASQADADRLGDFICAFLRYLDIPVRRVLDAGCGTGQMRASIARAFPEARYVGLEPSAWLCERFGWIQGSLADHCPRAPYDLVICHDVLQYLPEAEARRALANLGRLCRGALYFSVLSREDWRRNADRNRSDSSVHLRPVAWYQARLARQFLPLGGGLLGRRGRLPTLWELEKPWPVGAGQAPRD